MLCVCAEDEFNSHRWKRREKQAMYIYSENMTKPTLVDGSRSTTRSPLTSRPVMAELVPSKSDTVPLTPEILNSVMAMTNPLERFSADHSINDPMLQVGNPSILINRSHKCV